jgi:outer membrane protein TolC
MMRCNPAAGLLGLILVVVCGCAQPCFLTQEDYDRYHNSLGLPRDLETNPAVSNPPVPPSIPPGRVDNPGDRPRYIALQEAIAIALQQGVIGSQSVRFPGVGEDLITFGGPLTGAVGSDAIRVLSLNPAIIGANVERELARFDALWTTTASWTNTDEPVQGLSSLNNGMAASVISSIAKPLPTGGTAGITFENDYRILSKPPVGTFAVLNPSYVSKLSFGFEQPLLRFAGVDVNQVLGTFGGSNLFPGVNGRRASGEGILLARLRTDQQRADFVRTVNFQLLNVEAQYWNLYGAYVTLYSTEQAMRIAHKAWTVGLNKFEAGQIDEGELAGLRAQYEQFRGTRIQNVGSVLDAERLLRILLGMPVGDGTRLVPADTPTLAYYEPDWPSALKDALELRPELDIARQDLRTKQLNLIAQQTLLKPDLRFQSSYTAVGLGTRLDGNGQFIDSSGTARSLNAWRSLASDHFNDWSLGLLLNMPLGFRFEHATYRQAKLQLAQAYALLKEQEMKAQNQLVKQYRLLQENYRVTQARRSERQAWAERLRVFQEKIRAGKITPGDITVLDAERQWTTALTNEYQAIVAYNTALAAFQFTRGTIMQYDNVTITEGGLPQCAVVQAVDHQRERTKALVLREREAARAGAHAPGAQGGTLVPTAVAPNLPALDETLAAGKEPEGLPDVATLSAGLGRRLGELWARTRPAIAVGSGQSAVGSQQATPDSPARLKLVVPQGPQLSAPPPPPQPVRLGLPVGSRP